METSFEIDLPPGWHQYPVWFRHDAVSATEVAPNHFRWKIDNLKGIDLSQVQLHPAWAALAGRMTVHFSANPIPEGSALWEKIGTWYQGMASPESEGGTDISAEARTIAGDGDFMARLSEVADFMQQQIRYVGIEIGIGNTCTAFGRGSVPQSIRRLQGQSHPDGLNAERGRHSRNMGGRGSSQRRNRSRDTINLRRSHDRRH